MTPMRDSLEVPPVANGVFTLPPYEEAPPELLGGGCSRGHGPFFPRPLYCPRCLGELEETGLGSGGRIYSFTVVRTRAPFGLPEPYAVGYVDLLEAPLRVFCLLDPSQIDRLEIGTPVELRVGQMGCDAQGEPQLRPYFTPKAVESVHGGGRKVEGSS